MCTLLRIGQVNYRSKSTSYCTISFFLFKYIFRIYLVIWYESRYSWQELWLTVLQYLITEVVCGDKETHQEQSLAVLWYLITEAACGSGDYWRERWLAVLQALKTETARASCWRRRGWARFLSLAFCWFCSRTLSAPDIPVVTNPNSYEQSREEIRSFKCN